MLLELAWSLLAGDLWGEANDMCSLQSTHFPEVFDGEDMRRQLLLDGLDSSGHGLAPMGPMH
jgi:hypothetical protein